MHVNNVRIYIYIQYIHLYLIYNIRDIRIHVMCVDMQLSCTSTSITSSTSTESAVLLPVTRSSARSSLHLGIQLLLPHVFQDFRSFGAPSALKPWPIHYV